MSSIPGTDVPGIRSRPRDTALIRRSSAAGVAVGLVATLVVLWNGRLDPFRRARAEGFGSNFYDLQARALFHGHLDLPYRILGIESFNVDGRTYMYFPPFPAILRMPVLLITDRFDGRLTAPSMLTAWIVLSVATVALVWRARRLVRGDAPVSRTDAVASGVLIAAITGGTVLQFIAALPWVYHEVYLWSAAWAVAALACLARLALPGPRRRDILLLGGCVLGLILTRATAGWPIALAVIATGLWWAFRRVDRQQHAGWLLVACGAIAIGISAVINWIKFDHPYMIPVEYQQWTEVSAHRRLSLMVNDGSLAGFQFLPTTLVSYFRPDGVRFVPYFPFVTMPAEPARAYADAFIDQTYRTGSVPAFMPLLFLLAVLGIVVTFRRGAGRPLATMRIPLIGALGVTATMMCFGFIAFRYTSEYVALLAAGGAIGLAELTRRLVGHSHQVKRGALVVVGSLAAFSIWANVAVGTYTARATGRGGGLEQYLAWQDRVSSITGSPLARRIHVVDDLPPGAPPDDIYIEGDCDALYLSTGDLYEPWITVQTREHTVVAQADAGGIHAGVLSVFALDGAVRRDIAIESNDRNEVRLRFGTDATHLTTDWQPLPPGGRLELRLVGDTAHDAFSVRFGNYLGSVALAEWSRDWDMIIADLTVDLAEAEMQFWTGIALTYVPGDEPELCNRLRDRASD